MPHGVEKVAILVAAVTFWCPGTTALRIATQGEKNVPGAVFHQSGCYLEHDVTADKLLLPSSSRRAERPLPPTSAEQ